MSAPSVVRNSGVIQHSQDTNKQNILEKCSPKKVVGHNNDLCTLVTSTEIMFIDFSFMFDVIIYIIFHVLSFIISILYLIMRRVLKDGKLA